MKKINFKGFNLFSIIVAAVLLMIGTVLISTLVSTEEQVSTEIYLMTNNFQLSDAASLARADSIQSFNYNFRKQMQDYLTYSGSKLNDVQGFSILRTEMLAGVPDTEFEAIVERFERVILLTEEGDGGALSESNRFAAAIGFVSDNTIDQFHSGRYGKYHVSISDTSVQAKQNTRDAILEALQKDLDEGNSFLDVVGCGGDECPIGTFYFNIPLNKVSSETFETLPKIIVRDLTTNEEMKVSLLPRTNLRIYIPLRFFKAVHHAKDHLQALKTSETDLSNAKLGFCDPNSCVPRSNPQADPIMQDWDKDCVGSTQQLSSTFAGTSSYTTTKTGIGALALTSYAKQLICDEFEFFSGLPLFGLTTEEEFSYYNSILDPHGGTVNPINNCPFFRINTVWVNNNSKILEGTMTGHLTCTKIGSVDADVVFKETNPMYIVDGEEINFKIRISSEKLNDSSSINIAGRCSTGTDKCEIA